MGSYYLLLPNLANSKMWLPRGFSQTFKLSALRYQMISRLIIVKNNKLVFGGTTVWQDKPLTAELELAVKESNKTSSR